MRTTVGYGDLSPGNPLEMAMAVAFMIPNVGRIAYLLGTMTLLLAQADQVTGGHRAGMSSVERFVRRNEDDLDPQTKNQIRSYFKSQF